MPFCASFGEVIHCFGKFSNNTLMGVFVSLYRHCLVFEKVKRGQFCTLMRFMSMTFSAWLYSATIRDKRVVTANIKVAPDYLEE